jgi:hypothetical protein
MIMRGGKEVAAHFPSGWRDKLPSCPTDAAEGARVVNDLPTPRMLPLPGDEQGSTRVACGADILQKFSSGPTSPVCQIKKKTSPVYKLILVEKP